MCIIDQTKPNQPLSQNKSSDSSTQSPEKLLPPLPPPPRIVSPPPLPDLLPRRPLRHKNVLARTNPLLDIEVIEHRFAKLCCACSRVVFYCRMTVFSRGFRALSLDDFAAALVDRVTAAAAGVCWAVGIVVLMDRRGAVGTMVVGGIRGERGRGGEAGAWLGVTLVGQRAGVSAPGAVGGVCGAGGRGESVQGIEGAAVLGALGFAVELEVLGCFELFLAAEEAGGFKCGFAARVFLVLGGGWGGSLGYATIARICAFVAEAGETAEAW
jgi:hypothetical protein